MKWNEKCILELTHHNLFESTDHRSRFMDLLGCYWEAAFFTKGLCKCMYLAAWNENTFEDLLAMLNSLVIEGAKTLRLMQENYEELCLSCEASRQPVYQLSLAFLSEQAFEMPDLSEIDPETSYLLRHSLLAASYIDDLPSPHKTNRVGESPLLDAATPNGYLGS